MYLKEDRALRIESVVNDPGDLGCKRSLEHLEELAAKARARNARLMDAVVPGQDSGILANPVIERIAHPTCDEAGRRVPAMRFGDPRVPGRLGLRRLRHHQSAPSCLDDRTARRPLQHEPGLLGPGPATPQRPDRTDRPQQHLPAHARRAHLRPGLQPRPRPGALPPDRARPADRREVPRAFRTVHPLGWTIWKGEIIAPAEEELLT
jgi:hypothetical protein